MKSNKHNVGKILQLVDMYIDEALDNDEKQDLIQNIQSNPLYSELYRQEKEFRSFIKDNVKRPEVSQEFRDSIKQFVHKT